MSPTLLSEAKGHVSASAKASLLTDRRGRRPSARIETSSARTARPQRSPRGDARLERPTKAQRQSVGMNSGGESDGAVVLMKPAKKAGSTCGFSWRRSWGREGIQSRETWQYLALPGRRAGSIMCPPGWNVCHARGEVLLVRYADDCVPRARDGPMSSSGAQLHNR